MKSEGPQNQRFWGIKNLDLIEGLAKNAQNVDVKINIF